MSKMRWLSCFSAERELLTLLNVSAKDTVHDVAKKIVKQPKLHKDRPFRMHKANKDGAGMGTPIVHAEFSLNAFDYFGKEDDVLVLELMSEEEAARYKVDKISIS